MADDQDLMPKVLSAAVQSAARQLLDVRRTWITTYHLVPGGTAPGQTNFRATGRHWGAERRTRQQMGEIGPRSDGEPSRATSLPVAH